MVKNDDSIKYRIITSDKVDDKFGIFFESGEYNGILIFILDIKLDLESLKVETEIALNPKKIDTKSLEFEEVVHKIILSLINS